MREILILVFLMGLLFGYALANLFNFLKFEIVGGMPVTIFGMIVIVLVFVVTLMTATISWAKRR